MAGNLPIQVQKTRSHRTLMLAGTAAMLIATSQWARWVGFIDWDLLSAALGLAQSAQMSASSDVGPVPFDCPNHSLDAQSLALSGNVLKSVGKELCSNNVAEAQMLRGTEASFADMSSATSQRGRSCAGRDADCPGFHLRRTMNTTQGASVSRGLPCCCVFLKPALTITTLR